MRKLMTLLSALTISFSTSAATIIAEGTFDIGFEPPKKESISVNISADEGTIDIGGKVLGAMKQYNQIVAYDNSPKIYFYFELDLEPKRENGRIILSEGRRAGYGSLAMIGPTYCDQAANALLRAYRGNGISSNFCVTLK